MLLSTHVPEEFRAARLSNTVEQSVEILGEPEAARLARF